MIDVYIALDKLKACSAVTFEETPAMNQGVRNGLEDRKTEYLLSGDSKAMKKVEAAQKALTGVMNKTICFGKSPIAYAYVNSLSLMHHAVFTFSANSRHYRNFIMELKRHGIPYS